MSSIGLPRALIYIPQKGEEDNESAAIILRRHSRRHGFFFSSCTNLIIMFSPLYLLEEVIDLISNPSPSIEILIIIANVFLEEA